MSYAVRGGTRIYWTELSAGEPLLLIMGLGATHEWWYRLAPIVSTRFRTIMHDNRGVGLSDVPPGPYPIPEMADDAAAVLDAAGVEAAHVFGVSMGGMLAQELALRHPHRVRSLILGCTTPGGREGVTARREVLDTLTATSTMTREEGMRAMRPFIFDPSTPSERIDEDLRRRVAANVPTEGYLAQLQGIRMWSGTYSRLPSIAAPTLVIHGESDELIPPENARILARAIPGATLVMLPHASHIFMTDQTQASGDAVMSFLAAQYARAEQ